MISLEVYWCSEIHDSFHSPPLHSIKQYCSKTNASCIADIPNIPNKTTAVMFAILSAIEQVKFHLSSTATDGVASFGYAFCSSADLHC